MFNLWNQAKFSYNAGSHGKLILIKRLIALQEVVEEPIKFVNRGIVVHAFFKLVLQDIPSIRRSNSFTGATN